MCGGKGAGVENQGYCICTRLRPSRVSQVLGSKSQEACNLLWTFKVQRAETALGVMFTGTLEKGDWFLFVKRLNVCVFPVPYAST